MRCHENGLILFNNFVRKYLSNLPCQPRVHGMIKAVYRKHLRSLLMHRKGKHEQNIQRTFAGIIPGKGCRIFQILVSKLYDLLRCRNSRIQDRLFRLTYLKFRCPVNQLQHILHEHRAKHHVAVFFMNEVFYRLRQSSSVQSDWIRLYRIRNRPSQSQCVRLINPIIPDILGCLNIIISGQGL